MSMLTEQEYEEYIRLLRGWVDAEKALEGPGAPDAEASARSRQAHAAVQSFRERHGLGSAGVAETAAVYADRKRGQAKA